MRKSKLVLDKIYIILLCLVSFVGLWNLSIFFVPTLLFVIVVVGFTFYYNYQNKISIPVITLSFILLLLYEIINYHISGYKPNNILFLRDFFIIICWIFLLNKLLRNKKSRIYLVVFITLLGGILALFNIPIFFFRYYESTIHEFNDFSQFRFLYRPLGFLSNEWVTILLCFLPFPFIGLLLLWKNKYIRYGFIFIIGLLIFNIFISFSRAGILSFLLFIFLLNVVVCIYRIFSIKKVLISNIGLISFSFVLFFFFSESVQSTIQRSQSHQRSIDGRLKQWERVEDVVGDTPYFGVGSKNYALLGRFSQEFDLEYTFTGRINNTYLQLIIEKGWVGLSLWLFVIGIFIFYLFQRIKKEENKSDKAIDSIILSAVFAILFRELFFSSLLYNSGLLLLFLILLFFNHQHTIKYITIQKPLLISFVSLYAFSFIYFHFKQPDNALLFAEKGLEYERNLDISFSYNSLNRQFGDITRTQKDTLVKIIQLYEKASELSPSDAMFQHNLGWLYWANHQTDSAIMYLSMAEKSEPNVALYHISKGLIEESVNNDKEAFKEYQKAVLLSPDIIDSPFFRDLEERNPIETGKLLINSSNDLLQILSLGYSSVIEAKHGKILLSMGNTDSAYATFNHVTQIHPNLSRPWYYLGFIEQKKENFESMKTYYKKSLFLSPFDHLPLYAFAHYYNEISDKSKSDSYYKIAEKAWQNKRSVHSSQCKRLYFLDTNKDDVIPNGLLDYITPTFRLNYYDQD